LSKLTEAQNAQAAQAETRVEIEEETRRNERWRFEGDFTPLALDHQCPPALANSGEPWSIWLILGGRGAGKTTPRPIPLLKKIMADPHTAVTHAGTRANAVNLAPRFLETVLKRYGGTELGRQEIEGEMIEQRSDALWTRAMLASCRVTAAPPLARIVVAVDPPGSARAGSDACGIVAAGKASDGTLYVLADESAGGLSPQMWASRAIALWRRLAADVLVAEANFGGDMVRAVIRAADPAVPVTTVHATRGKFVRAEPVAQLYEQGRVRHVGGFAALEDEMCDFGLDGLSSGRSPDRLDALVWALTALTYGMRAEPRVRGI
jgi:phage terminase large subunit-like protein